MATPPTVVLAVVRVPATMRMAAVVAIMAHEALADVVPRTAW